MTQKRILAIHILKKPRPEILRELAQFLLAFTPTIGIRPPDVIYLDLTGTLRLFGGEEKIVPAVSKFFASKSVPVRLALADEAATAGALATHAVATITLVPQGRGEEALAQLSTQALHFLANPTALASPQETDEAARLITMLSLLGVHTLGAFAKIPAAEVTPRLGVWGAEMHRRSRARAFTSIDPFAQTRVYRETHAFEFPVTDLETMLFVGKGMLRKLEERLSDQLEAATELVAHLETESGEETEIRIPLLRPLKREKAFVPILRERLSKIVLTSPLLAFSLELALPVKDRGSQFHLFDNREESSEKLDELLGRLVAGIGPQFISAAELRKRHRPERSWQPALFQPFTTDRGAATPLPSRPAVLLPTPEPLGKFGNPKILRMEGPERLVGEWWDGGAHERDYFRAQTANGELLWIFRQDGEFYLHGYFD